MTTIVEAEFMKQITKLSIALCSLGMSSIVSAGEADVMQLDEKVNRKADAIAQTGLLPTATEMEVIKGDIVFDEMQKTGLTAEQAVKKYELTPTLERYIKIKHAQAALSGNGGGNEPPAP